VGKWFDRWLDSRFGVGDGVGSRVGGGRSRGGDGGRWFGGGGVLRVRGSCSYRDLSILVELLTVTSTFSKRELNYLQWVAILMVASVRIRYHRK
jgi:hypothetical protein